MADGPYGDVFQVVFHPSMRGAFERWLDARGLYLYPMPIDPKDDLPTFGIGIGQGLWPAQRSAEGAHINEGDQVDG